MLITVINHAYMVPTPFNIHIDQITIDDGNALTVLNLVRMLFGQASHERCGKRHIVSIT